MKYKILLLLTFLCAVPVYSQTAEEHFIKALELFKVSDYNKAKISSEKAIAIFKRDNIFPETYFLAVLLTAKCYEFLFEYDPAIELLEIAKKSYNENEDQIFALIISNLSSLYYAKFDFKKSETLMLEAIKVREKVLGKEHPDYSISINNLAELYRSIGDYAKAEQLFLEAMEINHKIFGEEHPAYALSLNNLAYLYYSMKYYSKAEPLFLQAIQIRKIALGEFDLNYALSLNNLAGLYSSIGNYTKAELLFLDIIRIYKIIFGEGHPDYARSLHNLASLYKSMGKNKDAEQLYLSAIEIRRKVLGIDHPDYASSLNNLAVLYNAMGKYSIAEPLFFEAIRIRKMVLGEENIDYATSLNDLAMLYSSMYNFSRAEPLYLEAMKIKKKVLGNEHPDYATILNNLALLYSSMGNYAKAEPMYLEAMGVLKKVLGSEHPDFAISLNNLAGIYQSMGSYLKSEPLYLEAMGVYKKVLGIENPDYATCLNNFAHLYKSIDNYSKAEQMYLESMEIRKKVLGIDHPDYALSLNNLAVLYSSMGKNEEAYPLLETALAVTQKQVKNTFTALSETEKTIFSKKNDHYYDISLSRSSFIPNVKSKSIYDRLLFRKGLILNSSINTRTFITSSNDEKLKQKYSDWLSVKHIINNLYSKTLEQRANSGYNLDSLENYANTIEKDLSKISSTFKDFVMIPDYKWEDVQKNLKHDEAIVDLVKFRFYNKRWTDTTRYGVFVTRFDSKEPEYFEFKDGNRIDTLVIPKFNEKNKNRFADVDTSKDEGKVIVLNQNEELDYYSELFAPIAQHLKEIKKIYFSLDGEFFKVNFNTLKNPKTDKYLIEEYEIVYLSSANEIAIGKTETTTNKTAVLAGFPNYDLSLDSLTAIVKSEQRSDENRDIYVNTLKIKQFNLDMLPGTKDEVIVTTELLKKNGWTVDSWLLNQATESNIKNVNAPGILSISTHGYFSPSPKEDYKENFFMGMETKKAVENPLLRSGLFLTGAETFLNSDETQKEKFAENGILTAYEVSQLNLFGTDLVILSACETGLGEVNNGEGVFGLQRGFLGAGAKSVLMSLWKVDDSATKDLMIEFFKNYSTTMNKQKSLRDAQLTIMKKYPQPYYWGAFVMIGD